ncbi:hypthetical protein [Escherichia coli]|nr:hypthetical protein [Escherichia coli]
MSVALIRDGVIRPSENDSHVLTAMLPRPARKTTRRIFCLCRMAR